MQWKRLWQHLLFAPQETRRLFPSDKLEALTRDIAHSEAQHRGEIRLIIEGSYSFGQLWAEQQSRSRALELFGQYQIWDTEENTGVLLYLLLAEHRIEIIADRGIARCVPQHEWDGLCTAIEAQFKAGQFLEGIAIGLSTITHLLAVHFPADADANPNELPDVPIIL